MTQITDNQQEKISHLMFMEINLGEAISKVLKEKEMNPAQLAIKINTTRQNVYRILKSNSIDVSMLSSICKALDYNFFQLYYTDSKQNVTTTNKAKVVIELDLDKDEILKFGLKDKILELIKK